MTLTPEAALELLKEIAGQAGETPEAQEFGNALYELADRVDSVLADRIVSAVSGFFSAHAKLVAVRFYREGEKRGVAMARQQQGPSGRAHRRPRPAQPRLQ